MRERVGKAVLNVASDHMRVVNKDVGGGFGMKAFMYPEQALVLIAAKKTGRPVRWTSDRTEAFLTDNHGRDMITKAELALDAGGKILAVRITGTANMGGYLSQFNPFVATLAGGRIFGGVYRVPVLFANIKGYFSNTAPVDAYRGAGRPEAAYLMERLMDVAARKTGIDRVELRRRNLPTPAELPYRNWMGESFDSGDYPRMLDGARSSAPTPKGSPRAKGNRRRRASCAASASRIMSRSHSLSARSRRASSSPRTARSSSMSARSRTGRGTRPRSRSSSPRSSASTSRASR